MRLATDKVRTRHTTIVRKYDVIMRRCAGCGGKMELVDSRIRYCSNACRQKAYRDRTGRAK